MSLATRSAIVLMSELAGTVRMPYSRTSSASGSALSSVTGALFEMIAPTMLKAVTRMLGLRFLPETNWAKPTVPPAPGMFTTCTPEARPSCSSACCIARAAWS